jgi:hypothetical protein
VRPRVDFKTDFAMAILLTEMYGQCPAISSSVCRESQATAGCVGGTREPCTDG